MSFRTVILVVVVFLAVACYITAASGQCSNISNCEKDYRPVCAEDSNGKKFQFNNRCLYNYSFKCDPKFKDYKKVRNGTCTTESQPSTTICIKCRNRRRRRKNSRPKTD